MRQQLQATTEESEALKKTLQEKEEAMNNMWQKLQALEALLDEQRTRQVAAEGSAQPRKRRREESGQAQGVHNYELSSTVARQRIVTIYPLNRTEDVVAQPTAVVQPRCKSPQTPAIQPIIIQPNDIQDTDDDDEDGGSRASSRTYDSDDYDSVPSIDSSPLIDSRATTPLN